MIPIVLNIQNKDSASSFKFLTALFFISIRVYVCFVLLLILGNRCAGGVEVESVQMKLCFLINLA